MRGRPIHRGYEFRILLPALGSLENIFNFAFREFDSNGKRVGEITPGSNARYPSNYINFERKFEGSKRRRRWSKAKFIKRLGIRFRS